MLTKFFNTLLEQRAFGQAVDRLERAIATEDAAYIGRVHAALWESEHFTSSHSDRLLNAALARGDADVFAAVMPGGNPNTMLTTHLPGRFLDVHVRRVPLLSAAILDRKPAIALMLAQHPGIDLDLRGGTGIAAVGGPHWNDSALPVTLAREGGEEMAEVSKILHARHILRSACPPAADR